MNKQWANGWNPDDTNADVIVTFSDRSKWIASFFSYKNIETLRKEHQQTGECLGGAFFNASDMVLIDCVSRERIEEIIQYLLRNRVFDTTFTRYPDVEPDEEFDYPEGFFDT